MISFSANKDAKVKLTCFTWGHVNSDTFKQDVDLNKFMNCTYGGMVFSKIP